MEQKFLTFKVANRDDRNYVGIKVNDYISKGWNVKQVATIPSDRDCYATVFVVLEKPNANGKNSTVLQAD